MKNYKLLSENALIPNNSYWAIVYYPYPSPNRNPMVEWVYYDQYRDWCGTDKDIAKIVDESVISVLFEYNPERACEIIDGGFTEDGYNNDILSNYDFKLQEKYKKYYINKVEGEGKRMADIALVIRISQEDYEAIKDNSIVGDMTIPYVFEAIRNGTPLPKGHGRLKDIDKIEELLDLDQPNNVIAENIKNIIDSVPTIIEKDYGSLEEEYLGNPVTKTGIYADVDAPKTVNIT